MNAEARERIESAFRRAVAHDLQCEEKHVSVRIVTADRNPRTGRMEILFDVKVDDQDLVAEYEARVRAMMDRGVATR